MIKNRGMKMNKTCTFILFCIFFIGVFGCQKTAAKRDIINDAFSEEQAQIQMLLDEIFASGQKKELDRLASYHLYGPKFTEFKNGQPRHGAEEGRKGEQEIFTAFSDFAYDLNDLNVNVFGDVAIATFHGHFTAKMSENPIAFALQATMVFVKDGNNWKITHEHFSPLTTAP
jgi:ketosteroid isomerase-like protein